ncbi:MAG: homoserine kinase [Dehalococcoidia bacterium]|nr:homoserine kinase [Dehalococcoidia bacterium]
MTRAVTVRVPATTANLGPGFDCLGMALDIYNSLSIARSDSFRIDISGEGAGALPRDGRNIAYRALLTLAEEAGREIPPLRMTMKNEIPLARGLGSSAAAIVGALVAADLFFDSNLSRDKLLEIAEEIEGHPDNVAPAILGGCIVVVKDGPRLVHAPVPLPPGLVAVLFIPDFALATIEARRVLPQQVKMADAVFNVGRTALLATCLATGRLDLLRVATQDALHQPWRKALFPAMEALFKAALDAGALGVFLSGAGPTILALTTHDSDLVAHAMREAAHIAKVPGCTRLARPSMQGAHLVDEE